MQIYKVGGAVRDRLLGRPVTEVDWVVVGSSAEEMQAQGFRPVGADFPVFLHPRTGEEYALARTERKSGRGYGGFTFFASPDVTLEEDLTRRDLTINAMAEDDHGQVIDPYGGQADLEARLLRHVSPAFAEDPLRVLRVARFAARYAELGFRVAPDTLVLMQRLAHSGELQALTPERSWKEIARALMEPRPDVFVQVLRDCHALGELFPVLDALLEHAPSDVAPGLLATLRLCAVQDQPLAIRWACLLHPLGGGDNPLAGDPVGAIDALNHRFKAPRDCQELSRLVGQFQPAARTATELEPQALFDLLQHFDIYRRPERFEQFLAACDMITRGRFGLTDGNPGTAYLYAAAEAARGVQVKPLIERGLTGAALGEALKRARLEAIEIFHASRSAGDASRA